MTPLGHLRWWNRTSNQEEQDGEWYCDACAEQERRLKRLKRLKDRDLIPDDVYNDRIRELVAAM